MLATRVKLATIVYVCLMVLTAKALSQVSAAATVRVTATFHGHISINTRVIPVSIALRAETLESDHTLIPLEFNWNLNPREVQGFEVIGYFADSNAALVGVSGNVVVPSANVLGRWQSGPFQSFNETHESGTSGASLSLFREQVLPGRSRGSRSGMLELSIDPQFAPLLRSDEYRGVLYIEVRQY